MWLEWVLLALAVAVALALRPWRAVGLSGPPWPWLAWWAVMPLLWGVDVIARMPIVQPLSGAALLVLLAGWPLAVLALLPLAGLVLLVTDMPAAMALQRLVWLGLVPASLALGLGAATRRWLPQHLFVYILGRAFLVTWLAATVAGALALWRTGAPLGTQPADLLLARFLSASGEAFLTGMVAAIFVAFRPEWLATYSDRLYLPRD